ncbi:hypothetical protein OH76DRAFT_265322 [Lentinus brumalis]|uniref:Uncharacterized protein n=1 Tax=Lentinus brumalis TaxID=2498619 RepID=A0A371DGP0_9APHY|nr:hypothetical protein OH76DRAFT_265322 [Polyporus brumalis]
MTDSARPHNGVVQSPTPRYGYQTHREVVGNSLPTPPPLPDEQDAERRRRPTHVQIIQNWYFATSSPDGTVPQYDIQVIQPPTDSLPVPRAREAQAGATPEHGINTVPARHDGNVPIDGVRGARVPQAQRGGRNESFAQSAAADRRPNDANAAPGQTGTREQHERRFYFQSHPNPAFNTAPSSSATAPARDPPSPRPTPPVPPPPAAQTPPAVSVVPARATALATATAPPAPAQAPAAPTAQNPMVDIYHPFDWGPSDPQWTPGHREYGFGSYRPQTPRAPSNQAPPIPYDPDIEEARARANTNANSRSGSRGSHAAHQGYQQTRPLPTPPSEAQQAAAQAAWYIPQNVQYVQVPAQQHQYWASCPHCHIPGAHNLQCPIYQQAVARNRPVVHQPPIQPDRMQNASRATNRSNASRTRGAPRPVERPRRAAAPEDVSNHACVYLTRPHPRRSRHHP